MKFKTGNQEMRSSTRLTFAALVLVGLIGCGGGSSTTDAPASDLSEIEKAAAAMEAQAKQQEAQAAADKQAADTAAAQALANEAPTMVNEDDFKKGKSLKGGGALSTIVRTRFVAEHRMNMIQVEHALNLFWGAEGRYPESHEEFLEKIVEANGLVLPELDGPYEYVYNPEDHQLYKQPLSAPTAPGEESAAP
jgi:hypothetical protein